MKHIQILILLLISVQMRGQKLTPHIISPAGFSLANPDVRMDATIGQIATSTLSSGSHHFTQGFEQPLFLVTAVENLYSKLDITVFPNPTGQNLRVKFPSNIDKYITLVLFDFAGRMRLKKERPPDTFVMQLNLSEFPDGLYLLTLIQNISGQSSSFKILKTQLK